MLTKSTLLLAGLSLLPGCPLLEASAEVKEVCLTYPNLQVEGIPAGGDIHQSFAFDDLSAIHNLVDLDASLEFVRAEARATSGPSDFTFVDAAKLTIASGDPMSTLPELTLYQCDGDCLPDGPVLHIPTAIQHDAVEYVKSDSLLVGLDLSGRPPATAWTMDVDVCLKGQIAYTLEP
jgi:hypothetical protein